MKISLPRQLAQSFLHAVAEKKKSFLKERGLSVCINPGGQRKQKAPYSAGMKRGTPYSQRDRTNGYYENKKGGSRFRG